MAISLLWMAASLLLLSLACAGERAGDGISSNAPAFVAPTASATATTAPPPTATATAVKMPSPTSLAPTLMPTPVPTATAAPTPTPEPSPTPEPTPTPDAPLVRIGNTVYVADLALTPEERTQGLSGRPSLDVDRAMLFVYERDGPLWFWMPDMHFPLDMVWIRADCTVAGITADVPNPPPDTPRDQLRRYPASEPVRFVLEINAGQAETHRITPGSPVEFAGTITGRWGC